MKISAAASDILTTDGFAKLAPKKATGFVSQFLANFKRNGSDVPSDPFVVEKTSSHLKFFERHVVAHESPTAHR